MLDRFQECSRNFIMTTAMFVFKFMYDAYCLFSCDLSECKISKLLVTEICFKLFLVRVRVVVNEELIKSSCSYVMGCLPVKDCVFFFFFLELYILNSMSVSSHFYIDLA